MKEKVTLSINIEPLNKINPLISRYMCNIMAVNVEAKSFVFSKEILEKLTHTLKGSPILTYYSNDDNQFAGHEGDYFVSCKTGRIKQTPELTAVGFVDYVSEPSFEIIDSKEWLTCICYLWEGRYSFLQGLSERKNIWQSVEVAVDYDEMPNGTKIVTEAVLIGLALIGVSPAFEGSTFERFSQENIQSEINLLKQEYEKFINKDDLRVESECKTEEISVEQNLDTLNKTELFSTKDNSQKTSKEGENVIKEAVEKFSLNSDQIREILRNGLSQYKYINGDYEHSKYYVDCYDAECVYVWDCEDDKNYSMKYQINDLIATIDTESKMEVIHGGYIPVGQQTEQMSQEEIKVEELSTDDTKTEEMSTEENKEPGIEDMSSNAFVDNTAMQELNDKRAEVNKELSADQMNSEEHDKDKMVADMKEEMGKMEETMKEMNDKMMEMEHKMMSDAEENTKLKEFKTSIEKQNKEFAVETTLKDVVNILPKEEIDTFRVSAEKFSLEEIDAWKNEVKAKAFNYSKNIPEKKPYIQVGLPISDKPKRGTGLWDN